MTILGYVFLALALLCTVLYVPIAATIRPVSGPDGMGLIVLLILSLARWILLAAAVTIAATRGRFSWVHPSHGVQWFSLMFLLTASGGMELWSLDAATSGWFGREARPWVGAFAVAVPLVIVLLAASALSREPTALAGPSAHRVAAAGAVLLMVVGAVVLGVKNNAGAKERRAYLAERQSEEERARNEKLAAFRALGATSPLRDWLSYTSESDDEIRNEAVESIRARPRLLEEVSEILQSDDPLPALRWLWLWTPRPPASYARPVYDAAVTLPDWARRIYDDEDKTNDSDVSTACEALVVIAGAFQETDLDFRRPFEAIRAFLQSRALPEEQMSYDHTYQARAMLQYWFDRHPTGTGSSNAAEETTLPPAQPVAHRPK